MTGGSDCTAFEDVAGSGTVEISRVKVDDGTDFSCRQPSMKTSAMRSKGDPGLHSSADCEKGFGSKIMLFIEAEKLFRRRR